jgi:cell fate regulator YaaT (PSP1 superfamily)
MAKKYLIQLYPWENPQILSGDLELIKGDQVVIETEFGSDLGKTIREAPNQNEPAEGNILRKATGRDLEVNLKNEERKDEIMKISREEIKRLNLPIKLVEVRLTLDSGNVIIFFTADGRVDFRDLVKNLSRIFHRSIRMQQIGSRDEARKLGGCGICGLELCCEKFSGNLPSITTDMARVQQINHRGSERISGLCGRLMCCLAYEASQYQKMMEGMPEIGSYIKNGKVTGRVVDINPLIDQVTLATEDGKYINIKKNELN